MSVKTKGGHEVVIKEYITGRESRAISDVFLAGVKVTVGEDGKPKTEGIDAGISSVAQDKSIEVLVVSVDGKTDDVLASVLDLPKADFDEVISALDKVQNGMTAEKKTR